MAPGLVSPSATIVPLTGGVLLHQVQSFKLYCSPVSSTHEWPVLPVVEHPSHEQFGSSVVLLPVVVLRLRVHTVSVARGLVSDIVDQGSGSS